MCSRITLGTKTAEVETRQPLTEVILTEPLPVATVTFTEVTESKATMAWAIQDDGSNYRYISLPRLSL